MTPIRLGSVTMSVTREHMCATHQVPPYVAFTGEINIMGDVLAVGGIQEKVAAALENPNITVVYIPTLNMDEICTAHWATSPHLHGKVIKTASTVYEVIHDLFFDRSGDQDEDEEYGDEEDGDEEGEEKDEEDGGGRKGTKRHRAD